MSKSNQIAESAKSQDNLEFLPAALEVLETPASPFGRTIAITIATFFLAAILWSSWGTIDVVAIAQGQIIPTGKVKIIQPLETGVVRTILVEEGQFVEEGDLLITLDPTDSDTNIESIRVDLSKAKLEAARGAALLEDDPSTSFKPPNLVDEQLIRTAKLIVKDEHARHLATLSALESEIERAKSAIRSSEIEEAKLKKTIPLTEERLKVQKQLFSKGIAEKSIWIALQQTFYEQQAVLANAAEIKSQSLAVIATLKARIAEAKAAFRSKAMEQRQGGLLDIAILKQKLKKEEQRQFYRELRAPVAGTVNQLAVHTVGAVVNTAEKLLSIVPQNATLEIEALLLNKDIGFVDDGQDVEIKLEAFPFTRYGTLIGKLKSISQDTIIHEKLGPVYKIYVSLNSQVMAVDGKMINLSPGMNASVEVKTGKRQILDFFLSPLLRYKDEAIRER